MSTLSDLTTTATGRTFLDLAALGAELDAAEREARARLEELRAVEREAPPPPGLAPAAASLGRKLSAAGNRADPLTLQQAPARVRAVAGEIGRALDTARAWAEQVERACVALAAGLDADPAVKAARRGAATAARQLGEIEAQIAERRAALAALGDAPASVERAGAWASERRALGDEIAALEGLALGPRHAAQEAARAAEEAQAAAVARLAAEQRPDADALRREWAAARQQLDAAFQGRIAEAERTAAAVAQAAGRLS